jgi:hypothetical protein
MLRQRQQAFVLRGNGDAVDAVHVQHALRILAGLVDRTVDQEAGRVHFVRAGFDLAAAEVHFHQAGRRDLVEHHPVRVDQEVVFRPRHPR